MKQFTSAVLAALFAGALAHPGHGTPRANEERDLVARVGNINGTQTFNASLVDDHVPIFQAAACVCPTPVCDPRLNADSQCQCKAQAKLACYMQSNGACPKPEDNSC